MGPAADALARVVSWSAGAVAALAAERRWRRGVEARPHGLAAPLVVSLTSYGPRLGTAVLTLKCLLRQSLRPDEIILWLTPQDLDELPAAVRAIADRGVSLKSCEDLRSYKKIIPALRARPDAVIVTADDDVFYGQRWLEELVTGWSGDPHEIVARRARQIALGEDGTPLPYARWRWRHEQGLVSTTLLPVGVGGVLFPPDVLAPQTDDPERFMALCPTADDLWLYWMARANGARVRKVSRQRTYFFWPRTQDVGLANLNRRAGANDVQIRRMIQAFGFPPP